MTAEPVSAARAKSIGPATMNTMKAVRIHRLNQMLIESGGKNFASIFLAAVAGKRN